MDKFLFSFFELPCTHDQTIVFECLAIDIIDERSKDAVTTEKCETKLPVFSNSYQHLKLVFKDLRPRNYRNESRSTSALKKWIESLRPYSNMQCSELEPGRYDIILQGKKETPL